MTILEAITIANAAIKLGDVVIDKLKGYGKETISREEFEGLFDLPDFNSFSKKATEEQGEKQHELF